MMKKGKRILTGLIVICTACVISVASRSPSPQTSNKATSHVTYLGFAVDPPPGAITSGRARSLVAAVVGLISVVIGGLALARSAGRIGNGNGRAGAMVALALGLIGMVLSVVHLGMSTGGFGTGSGRAGAIVALVLSLVGMNLGGLALARARRSRSA
jgi:Family of unknown function (DUF6223)